MKLYHDDCFHILPTLDGIDLCLTDPPYGQTHLEWDIPIDWASFWNQIRRIMKPTGIVLIFGIQPMVSQVIMSNSKDFRYDLIWLKTMPTGYLDANRKPLRVHEHILFFSQRFKGTTYNPQKKNTCLPCRTRKREKELGAKQYANHKRFTTISDGDRYPTSILHFSNSNHDSQHPTQKPISLLTKLILTYSNPNDVILDPFMGSGSTGIAALGNNRDFIGIEKDMTYYSIAEERIANEINQLKLA